MINKMLISELTNLCDCVLEKSLIVSNKKSLYKMCVTFYKLLLFLNYYCNYYYYQTIEKWTFEM